MVRDSGVPQLSQDQFRRYQNIVAIDYFIGTVQEMGFAHSLFHELEKKKRQLNKLTKKMQPEELLKEMIALSQS